MAFLPDLFHLYRCDLSVFVKADGAAEYRDKAGHIAFPYVSGDAQLVQAVKLISCQNLIGANAHRDPVFQLRITKANVFPVYPDPAVAVGIALLARA